MKTTLICPCRVPAVSALEQRRPLALAPFLGQTVVEHALAGLAATGYQHVQLMASDRLHELQSVVRHGEAWGLKVDVLLRTERARILQNAISDSAQVLTLNSLPQLPQQPLWRSYRDWHRAQKDLIPILAPQTVGMREVAPGVFVGLRSKLAANVSLQGPIWIGAGVSIRSGAVIRAGTIIEDGSYVDEGAELSGSVIGPGTYVGKFTEIIDSFAWGNALLSFDSGSLAELTDPFLLTEVRIRKSLASGWLDALRGARDDATAAMKESGSTTCLFRRTSLKPA